MATCPLFLRYCPEKCVKFVCANILIFAGNYTLFGILPQSVNRWYISPCKFTPIKFYKANKTVRGSGIGLAVADEIIKQHSGLLFIESTEGVGTTVTIVLPIYEEELTEEIQDNITEEEQSVNE